MVFCLLNIWAILAPNAAGPGWKAGLAQTKITPTEPLLLSGYASRHQPFTAVNDDLFAKALALEDQEGNRAVLVTTDLIGFRASMAEPLCKRICRKTGLKRSQILLNSSHTHSGPSLSLDTSSKAYEATPELAKRRVTYTLWLMDEIESIVLEALSRLRPARLSYNTGVATFVMNRRQFLPGGVRLGVNPRGLVDRSVPVLRIDTPEGKLLAVLFGCACHNTTLTGKNLLVSGDYAGFAQRYIEEHHPNVQVMFMLGLAGSANPYPKGTFKYAQVHGTTLGEEVCRLLAAPVASTSEEASRADRRRLESMSVPVTGKLRTKLDYVDLPLSPPPSLEEIKANLSARSWQGFNSRAMLALLERGEKPPKRFTCPMALWQFGDDLTLLGLSGEVVGEYVPLIEKVLGHNRLWLAAYCNDVFGYVPTAEILSEGGYETRGVYHGGTVGQFAPKVEKVLIEKVREMAQRAGRIMPKQ